ncbi:MAG: UDP-N-acetylmuramate dehydrogenase [Clostridia bacterium]|nr:UDP-N-acetylmuramate dehydrogenase [Clostridia bacterium]
MEDLLCALQRAHVEWEKDVLLAPHSSFRIGGRAELALFPHVREELVEALRLLREACLPFVVIGSASNVVFPDEGLRGAVIFTDRMRRLEICGCEIMADAGVPLSALAVAARDVGLAGAEFAYGIPGTVGGAVFMNAGAFGGCMAQICAESYYCELSTGVLGSFAGEEQRFGNRTGIYEQTGRYAILGARLVLTLGDREAIAAHMADYRMRRKTTQPLEFPSAGSVFKRPEGHFAGKLIEDCGLKGLTVGGAQVSEKHAGFIINRGGATAEDVKTLVAQIREIVLRQTGVELECEIRFLENKD